MDWVKTTTRRHEKHLSFMIWCAMYLRFDGNSTTIVSCGTCVAKQTATSWIKCKNNGLWEFCVEYPIQNLITKSHQENVSSNRIKYFILEVFGQYRNWIYTLLHDRFVLYEGQYILRTPKLEQPIRSSDKDSTGFWPPGSLPTLGADGHI